MPPEQFVRHGAGPPSWRRAWPSARAPSSRPRPGRAAARAHRVDGLRTCCQRPRPSSARSAARTFQASVSSARSLRRRRGWRAARRAGTGRLRRAACRLLGHAGPGPGGEVGWQAVPAVVELSSGGGRGRWRPAASAPAWSARLRRDWPRRSLASQRAGLSVSSPSAWQASGSAGPPPAAHRGPVGVDREARLCARHPAAQAPCASTSVAAAARSRRRHRAAPARPAPRPARPCRLVIEQQGVAAHLAVVVHAEARVLGGKVGPVAPLAELEQPVVAQPVLDVGAAPARRTRQLVLLRLGSRLLSSK